LFQEDDLQDRQQLVKFYSRPQLKAPFLIAGGPGTANVGLTVVNYLREKLAAELFAEIEPGAFFAPPYSFTFQDGLIELLPVEFGEQAPHNRFYWKPGKEHDLVLFLGDAQPLPGKVPELADYVLEVARSLNVEKVFTPGAFITDVYHLDEPTVYGVATNRDLVEYLDKYHIPPSPSMNIAYNLIAWLLGTAKKKSIDAIGMISEIPFYNVEGDNNRACRALVRILSRMLNLEGVDLIDLDYKIAEEEQRIEQKLEELKGSMDDSASEFIGYIEQLKNRREGEAIGQKVQFPTQEELPESLRHIEELYHQARQDKSRVPALKDEVGRLESFNRLLLLRKYGDELLRLLEGQI